MRIGLCGTGKMGTAIALRLLGLGHAVTVWNRDAGKLRPLVEAGATAAPTPAACVAASDATLTMLLNAEALDCVYRGEAGILAAPLAGKLVIDMSTVLPATEQALAADVRAKGGAYVECPVGGTVGPAREGKLFGLCGAEEADFARARPVLEPLCRRLEHVGPVGAGATMKLAINLPLLVYWQALGEALALCRDLPISAERLLDLMGDSSGAAAGLKGRAPEILRGLHGEAPPPGQFDVSAGRKDLAIMLAQGELLGCTLPTAAAAIASYEAAIAAGLGDADTGRVTVYVARGK